MTALNRRHPRFEGYCLDEKYYVYNQRCQSFLHLGVSLADTSFRRLRGLLGRWSLRSDEGIWVKPSRGIHTIGLFFPIDVIYLDGACRVVHLIEHLKPFRIASLRMQCESVLELPPRSIYVSNTQIGDQLLILTPEQMQRHCESERHAEALRVVRKSETSQNSRR
jgi:uncharacterized membrane protein (UPF0127 family)